jgi:signal transduction histidine kinase
MTRTLTHEPRPGTSLPVRPNRAAARRELAAELYRTVGETLVHLARRVDQLLVEGDAASTQPLRELRTLTTHALHSLREVTDAMDALRNLDRRIDRALRTLAADVGRVTGAAVDVRVSGPIAAVDERTARILFLVAYESMVNIDRHARVSFMTVDLAVVDGWAVLEVRDDGVDVAQRTQGDWRSSTELGLASVARTVEAAGGVFRAFGVAPRGLALRAALPLTTLPLTNGEHG